MKKISISIFILFITGISLNAQQPWQQLSDLSVKEIAANFKSSPAEYGMILWWGWEGPMTDTVIKRDLDRIKAMGFRGVMVEAGYGMTAKYLSPEWFALVKIAVEEAKSRGMRLWIEDEGKYPSGLTGGKFSEERPDLKMQGLVVTERIDANGGESISKKLPYYIISTAAFNNDDKTSKIIDVSSGELKWAIHELSGKLTAGILEVLPVPDFKTDIFYPQVKYLHRTWKDANLYFIFNESKESVSFNVSLSGNGKANIWDAASGQILPLKSIMSQKGRTNTQLKLEGWETRFIIIRK
ncbi:MAG: glycosyl hydrolase [Bacteroidia bacterium]|nr:glycosyl hydrolase [Bacteroidia bacterium]